MTEVERQTLEDARAACLASAKVIGAMPAGVETIAPVPLVMLQCRSRPQRRLGAPASIALASAPGFYHGPCERTVGHIESHPDR